MNDLIEKLDTVKNKLEKIFKNKVFGKSFEYLYNRGIDLYNKQKYEKAIILFKQAIEAPEAQPQVYYNLGLSYQYLKNYEDAAETYKKFLELRPNDHDGLYNLALTYYTLEFYDNAIELFEKCLELIKDEDGVKALVLAYLNNNQIDKAINLANSLIDIPEIGAKLMYAVGKIFESKNSINRDYTYIDIAVNLFKKIADVSPKDTETYLSLSVCYAKKGDWANSVLFCEKALEINPTSFEANNQMGLVYYCKNDIEKSIKYYETALKLKPNGDFKIYSNMAYAYEKIGDIPKAIKIFTKLVNKFPKCPARDEIKNHLRILKTLD